MTNTALLRIWKGVQSSVSLGNTGVTDALPEALDLYDGDFNIKDENGGTWIPQIATLKNNGIRADSAMQDGSDLIGAAVGNVIETITLYAGENITTQARMYVIKKLLDFARSSREFHASGGWQYQPVYAEWQAAGAPGSQFALIYNMDVAISRYNPVDSNDVQEITLTIEREPAWRGIAPFDNPKKWIFGQRGLLPGSTSSSTEYNYDDLSLDLSILGFYSPDSMPNDPLNIIPSASSNAMTGYRHQASGGAVTNVAMYTPWTYNYKSWATGAGAGVTLTLLYDGVSHDCPASASTAYRATMWVKTSAAITGVFDFINQAGTVFGTVNVSLPSTGLWTKITVTGTTPGGTTSVRVRFTRSGTTSTTLDVAGLMINEGLSEPVGYNTGTDALKTSFVQRYISNYDELLTENVNWVKMNGDAIPGDAPALALVSFKCLNAGGSVAVRSAASVFFARSTTKDYLAATSPTNRKKFTLNGGDATLGSSVAALTITKPVDATDGLLSNGSTATRYVLNLAHTIAAITGHTVGTWTRRATQYVNKYQCFIRGVTSSGTFSELSYSVQISIGSGGGLVSQETPYVALNKAGYSMTLLGMLDLSKIFNKRRVDGDGQATIQDFTITLRTSKVAGAAVANFKMIDLILMPYDEALMQAIPDQYIETNEIAFVDRTGYFNDQPTVLLNSAAVVQPRGQYITLVPGVENMVAIAMTPATSMTSQVTINIHELNVDFVPRWYGVRDV